MCPMNVHVAGAGLVTLSLRHGYGASLHPPVSQDFCHLPKAALVLFVTQAFLFQCVFTNLNISCNHFGGIIIYIGRF